MSRPLPLIHHVRGEDIGPFHQEHLDLEFSNGERRHFQRLVSRGHGAVVVVPMLDEDTVLLVREYAAGMHRYELGLVKGRIDAGETPAQAGDRELKEEAGFGAERLELIAELSLSPGYMSQKIQVVLARDLYAESLPGDEPEPLRVDKVNLRELSALAQHPQFTEGRALAALYLVRDLLTQRGEFKP